MSYIPDINCIVLVGLTLTKLESLGGTVEATTSDGRNWRFYHDQDCCESVGVHDVKGKLADLLGFPLLGVVEKIGEDWPDDVPKPEYVESFTWTTFTFITAKGTATIRWLGESNGYYGEGVSFCEVK